MAALVERYPMGGSHIFYVLDADPITDAVGYTPANTGDMAEVFGVGTFRWLGGAATNWERLSTVDIITDPGAAGAIPVTRSGYCGITTAAAETRTMAIPTFLGQKITLHMTVFAVGAAVVTVASAIDAASNTICTFNNAKDFVVFEATETAGVLDWSVVNHGGGVGFA